MKIVKKAISIVIFIVASLVMYSTIVKAASTVTIATEVLNLREKPSTSSDIVATLSEGLKCELIEESGDWYKVKYKTYTGYVSKEYVKKNGNTNQDNNNIDNSNQGNKSDIDNNKQDNKIKDDNSQQKANTNIDQQLTGKISTKTDVKIVPLIYSSKLDELAKNTAVTILSEMNGWAYIQTDTITGWIRSSVITDKKTVSIGKEVTSDTQGNNNNLLNDAVTNADNNNQTANNVANDNQTTTSNTEKILYISESSVNVRKEPNTSSKIMMVLGLNTKLTVIGESGDWYKVKTSEGNGYVLKKLLSSKQMTTSRGNSLLDHVDTVVNNKVSQTATSKVENTVTKDTQSNSTTLSNTSKGQEIVNYAKNFLGVPYVYGGASKSGFDCSGFTMYVYKKFGISMKHGAQSQSKLGKVVKADKKSASSLKQNLQLGDLVFFLDYETMDEIGHCGIYIGDGKFIHASSGSGYCVKINSLLPGEYYNTRYCAARRVL